MNAQNTNPGHLITTISHKYWWFHVFLRVIPIWCAAHGCTSKKVESCAAHVATRIWCCDKCRKWSVPLGLTKHLWHEVNSGRQNGRLPSVLEESSSAQEVKHCKCIWKQLESPQNWSAWRLQQRSFQLSYLCQRTPWDHSRELQHRIWLQLWKHFWSMPTKTKSATLRTTHTHVSCKHRQVQNWPRTCCAHENNMLTNHPSGHLTEVVSLHTLWQLLCSFRQHPPLCSQTVQWKHECTASVALLLCGTLANVDAVCSAHRRKYPLRGQHEG